jgi:hypothetical protein
MHNRLLAIAILALSRFSVGAAEPTVSASNHDKLSANLAVEVDGPLLASLPLQLKLTITNTGKSPFYYWCGGPDRYPAAYPFIAAITDASGHTRKYGLHNGQYVQGSGNYQPISATQSLPAACGPLGPGTYTVAVTGESQIAYPGGRAVETWPAMIAKPFTVKIKDDPPAVAAAEKALMVRAEKEPFARHLVRVYGIDPIVKTWLVQLLNDDPKIAFDSVGELQHVLRLPAGGDAMFQKAALKHCHLPPNRTNNALLNYITLIACNLGTDGAMEAVLVIARSDADGEVRAVAVGRIGQFRQKKAEAELLTFVAKKATPLYWPAIWALAARRNPVALDPLLQAAKDNEAWRRIIAAQLLRGYRDNSAAQSTAQDVFKAALNDPDPAVRDRAKAAVAETKDQDDEF